ncbi:MAG: hypothetical protein P8Y13_08880 [Deinococcales bacterium]
MNRFLTLLVATLAFGTLALASSLPANGSVTVTNDQGTVVGTGNIVNGTLSLTLQPGASGFVSLTVTNTTTNETETYQAMVKNGTTVTVIDGTQFKDLNSFAKDGGVESVDVTESSDLQQPGTNDSSASNDSSSQNESSASGSSSSQNETESSSNDSQTGVGTSMESQESRGSTPDTSSNDSSQSGSSSTDD